MPDQDIVTETMRKLFNYQELTDPSPVVIGTAEQSEQQMRALDEYENTHPSEVVNVKDGTVRSPDMSKIVKGLPRTPAIYKTDFLLDSVVRFDTSFTAAGVTFSLPFPNSIPQGKYAFIDEILIAQISGAGSSPSGFLVDSIGNPSMLFAILTPDGSTVAAGYKSGRNIIPGGINPQLIFNSLVAAATYVVGVQYKLKTRIDIPVISLSDLSGDKDDSISFDDANEVGTPGVGRQELPGGPYDDSGYDGV